MSGRRFGNWIAELFGWGFVIVLVQYLVAIVADPFEITELQLAQLILTLAFILFGMLFILPFFAAERFRNQSVYPKCVRQFGGGGWWLGQPPAL